MATFRIQPHVRLQEWVADENGFFREEGLDYEFEPQGLAAASWTTASVQPGDAALLPVRSGALEDMEKGRSCSVRVLGGPALRGPALESQRRRCRKALRRRHSDETRTTTQAAQPPPQTQTWSSDEQGVRVVVDAA